MEPEKKEPTRPIIDQLKEYAETRAKLFKYEIIERSTSIIANVITDVAVILVLLLTFLFASFTLALFLGDVLHSNWQGFAGVTILYAIIATVIAFAKRSFERPIINAMVRKFFK